MQAMCAWLAPHLPVLAVLLPSFTAIVLLWLGDQAPGRLARARWVGLVSVGVGLWLALALMAKADDGALQVVHLGQWPAPFGIVLVVDRLSALMLVLSAVTALAVLLYASGGWDSHGRYFHALFQFQLMGLNGAFVTGDVFNLFVFFEVLLIASYVLMLHGLGRERLRAGLHYVVLNLAASAVFLIGVSLLYAMAGTLNLADLALRVPQLQGDAATLAQVAALLLLVVFGFKAALMPWSMWLPSTYAAASAPVAALFAIMTKVGVYAILRVHGVVFGAGAGEVAQPFLLPLGLLSCAVGVLGAWAAPTLGRLVAWINVASVGTILAGLGLPGSVGWSGSLYYLVHSTVVVAALFLMVELVAAQRGEAADRLVPGSPMAQPALLGLMLLLAAASVAGIPPLPGFVGKLMLLQAAAAQPQAVWFWAVVLGSGLVSLVALARAGSELFWHVQPALPACPAGGSARLLGATLALLGLSLALSVWADPLQRYTQAAALQLQDRAAYAEAVLLNGTATRSTRPYTGVVEPQP